MACKFYYKHHIYDQCIEISHKICVTSSLLFGLIMTKILYYYWYETRANNI